MDLFSSAAADEVSRSAPLPVRMRPRRIEDLVGHGHLIGEGGVLRELLRAGKLPSLILWGPPGSGKTTLAHVLARAGTSRFEEVSATAAGVREVRQLLADARERLGANGVRTILFIDEIHRFSRSQQDALLPGVEEQVVTLIGATTESPYFALTAPLLSRCVLLRLGALSAEDLQALLARAVGDVEHGLGQTGVSLEPGAAAHLAQAAAGDARHALVALEVAAGLAQAAGNRVITCEDAERALQQPRVRYDRAGDDHYDVTSALIKSIRGSDPDAALHYLSRMLAAGEDPRFIARRLMIAASEDVGLADGQALLVAVAAAQALELVGLPEARYALVHATLRLALAPKSDAVGAAWSRAVAENAAHPEAEVPLHLRSGTHPGERAAGIGVGYRNPHGDPGHRNDQQYLPHGLRGGYLRLDQERDRQGECDALYRAWSGPRVDSTRPAAPGDVALEPVDERPVRRAAVRPAPRGAAPGGDALPHEERP